MDKTNQPKLRTTMMYGVIRSLAFLRKKRGLSQEALNFKIGMADSLLAKWEVGIRNPSLFNFFCWVEALGARVVIVTDEGNVIENIVANDNHMITDEKKKECS